MNHFCIGSCFCQYVYWTFTMMALESVCQFWVLMTKVLLLLPVSELVLFLQWYNVTQQWHQIFSFSLIIVDWTRLPLSFATRAGRWDSDRFYSQFYKVYLEGCLKMMTWLKINKSLEWIAMFRTKRTNTLQCRCFSTAISQHVLVYLCHQTLKYLELRWEWSRPSLVNSPPASIEPTARARTRVQSLLKY